MCKRYVLVSKLETIEKRYNVSLAKKSEYWSSYNISSKKTSMIVTQEEPHLLQSYQFGFKPSWTNSQMIFANARAEGDHNKEDDPNYKGGFGILQKPAFKQSIRNKRCLVIADCFYQESRIHGKMQTFVVYLQERRPFSFAGVYNVWNNSETGECVKSFAIITTQANDLIRQIGGVRSPVILSASAEHKWLHGELSDATQCLYPFPSKLMNAYSVSLINSDTKIDDNSLVQPTGEKVNSVRNDFVMKKIVKRGFNV